LKRFLGVFLFIILILPFLPVQRAKAATDVFMLQNGNFYFVTTDTAATTNITWETIGFTVRRDESDGNPFKDNKYATFMLKSGQKEEKDIGGGKKEVTFYLTKKQVNTALSGTDLKTIKDNDELYLNAIIKVHNGTNGAGPYYTLDGIKNAEAWRDTSDFDDRFDRRIFYNAGNQEYPVTITYQLYQSGSYTTIETKNYGNHLNHADFKLDSDNVPDSKINNNETYYLYRTYYQNLPKTTKLGNRKTSVDKNKFPDQYANELRYLREDRELKVIGAEEGDSLNVVAIYRRYPEREDSESRCQGK